MGILTDALCESCGQPIIDGNRVTIVTVESGNDRFGEEFIADLNVDEQHFYHEKCYIPAEALIVNAIKILHRYDAKTLARFNAWLEENIDSDLVPWSNIDLEVS